MKNRKFVALSCGLPPFLSIPSRVSSHLSFLDNRATEKGLLYPISVDMNLCMLKDWKEKLQFSKMRVFNISHLDSLISLLLPDDEIHLWKIFTNDCVSKVNELEALLSKEEMGRVERFHFKKDKIRFIAAHGMLRKIIGRYLNLSPHRVVFKNNSKGKPKLQKNCGVETLSFNISHSHDLMIVALSRYPNLGIDVEFIRPIPGLQEIVNNFFHPEERSAFMRIPLCKRQKLFFYYWTRKEAFVKATGEGLTRKFDSFSVSMSGETEKWCNEINNSIFSVDRDWERPENWNVLSLLPAPGYTGALVFPKFR